MKRVKILWYILTITPIILIILGYLFPISFFNNQESIRNFVSSFGALAPIIFIFIQILQVIITPFSHYTISIAGGFIFGLWKGFLYNWIGRVLGTLIAFYIARIFGRKLVEKVVKKKTIIKYDRYFTKGKILLFLAYFLPVFPDDELSYLAGISSLKPSIFIPIAILGHLSGSLSLAYLGNGIKSVTEPFFIVISLITLLGGILFALFYSKSKK